MTINIRSSGPGWTRVPHTLARDPRLTNGARGLAVQLLSHADGYRSDEEFLAGCTADSRNAVRKQLAELRQFGYLVRERVRGEDGKVTTRSVLYDVPQTPGPEPEAPPSRRTSARRSDQGRFSGTAGAPANTPWRDGPTSGNEEKPQAEPSRHPGSETVSPGETRIAAGETDSPYVGAQSGDQQEQETKEISQSAREREAVRHLSAEYRLTDQEALTVWNAAKARSPRAIDKPVPYLKSMTRDPVTGAPKADLADIVEAVQLRSTPAPLEPGQPDDDRHLTSLPTAYSQTAAEAIAAANPDHKPAPDPTHLHAVGTPICTHGRPNGAIYNPASEGPACGPCRMHAIACKQQDPDTCLTCRELAAAGWVPPPDWTPPAGWTPPARKEAHT